MAYSKAIFRVNLYNGSDTAKPDLTGCNMTNSGGVVSVNKTAHGLVNGAVVTVPAGTYAGDWLIKRIDADNFTLHSSHAIGVMTINDIPLLNETFTVGTQTFTFKANRTGVGEVSISTETDLQAQNIADAINTDIGGNSGNYMAFIGDTDQPYIEGIERVVIYYLPAGTSGNAIALTANANGIEVNGSGTLTGGGDSVYSANRLNVAITPKRGSTWADGFLLIAPKGLGNRIAVCKTPNAQNSGLTATFTNNSTVLTLSAPVTAHIDTCIGNTWTTSPNVTGAAHTTNRVLGASSQEFTLAAAFTTGKVAYKTLSQVTDFSAYQQISLWIQFNLPTSSFKICLCSDTVGDVIVNSLPFPLKPSGLYDGLPLTINYGSALGSNIQSVALYVTVADIAANTIRLNNLIACKAPSAPDCISHSSLIGKNNGKWYLVTGIDGTTVNFYNSYIGSPAYIKYYGASETVPLYTREPFNYPTNITTVNGTATSIYSYDFGWNTITNVEDSLSIFRPYRQDGGIYGKCVIFSYSGSYNRFYRYGTVLGTNMTYAQQYQEWSNCLMVGSLFDQQIKPYIINRMTHTQAGSSIFIYTGNTNSQNLLIINSSFEMAAGVAIIPVPESKIINCSFGGNGTSGLQIYNYNTYRSTLLQGNTFDDAIEIYMPDVNSMPSSFIAWSLDTDKVIGNNIGYTNGGSIIMQNATKGGLGKEWKTILFNAYRNISLPVEFGLAQVAVKAGVQVTVSCYCTKDHATNIAARLAIKAQYRVLNSERFSQKGNDTNRELLSVTFTPKASGVIQVVAQTWYVAGNSNSYFDTISITQA